MKAAGRKAVLYDVPERPIVICGPDSVAFLNYLLSHATGGLSIGRGRSVIACTHNDGIFIDGVLFRHREDCFRFVQPDGDMTTWLLVQNTGFDITVSDPRSRDLQLQGPASLAILHTPSDGEINDSICGLTNRVTG